MSDYAAIEKEARIFTEECVTNNRIDPTLFAQYDIKRGLRDKNGKGVLAGITNISRIDAFEERDGQKVPCEGKLWYRGYNVYDLIRGLRGKRYAFEGAAYLLLLGDLPNKEQLESFTACLAKCRDLPTNFVRDVIMKAPSHDLMNSLTRSVLTLANYDDDIGKTDLQTQLEQCIKLISVFPMLAVYGYHAYNYYECGGSMYIHRPDPSLSTAENLLKMLRPDQKYTDLEAHVLDIALLLHMEHGGGNNSTFTVRVTTSSGTDTYSAIVAAMSSLKGPRHGGANSKVMAMMEGVVVKVGQDKTSGKYVTLRHGRYTVSYCHLSKILIVKGAIVHPRDVVGITGSTGRSTGEHLHITCKLNGRSISPSLILDYIQSIRQECISALAGL